MNIRKEYIPCDCNYTPCQHYNDPCCKVSTEIVRVADHEEIDIFFVGMGAGKDEDINLNPKNINHQPFFGRSGKYLRSILKWLWDSGEEFNIALSNNVRCHPRNQFGRDREPTKNEIDACIGHLHIDICSVRPKVVVPLGKNASLSILQTIPSDTSMGQIRAIKEKIVKFNDIPTKIIPTYHPSYLCRTYGSFNPYNSSDFDNRVISDIRRAVTA